MLWQSAVGMEFPRRRRLACRCVGSAIAVAREPCGIHTLTFIGRAELGELRYQLLMRSPRASLMHPPPRGRPASADLFGQGDDDARGAAEVAEPEDALVLRLWGSHIHQQAGYSE
jgi:hypothetical protein